MPRPLSASLVFMQVAEIGTGTPAAAQYERHTFLYRGRYTSPTRRYTYMRRFVFPLLK